LTSIIGIFGLKTIYLATLKISEEDPEEKIGKFVA
jgi:hypothetical protein